MQKDFIITLAWPEGMVAAPGSWYDKIASKNGQYRVGHSAVVLINSTTNKSCYFDFGRYHTPEGYGRVRDFETDPDLTLVDAEIEGGEIVNIKQILVQLSQMKATHGTGKLYASIIKKIDFFSAFDYAKKMQEKGMISYGPFVRNGTNCSRFVASVIISAGVSYVKKIRFKYPFCISPSPKRNVCISSHNYYIVEKNTFIKVEKSKLQAYFSSIEKT